MIKVNLADTQSRKHTRAKAAAASRAAAPMNVAPILMVVIVAAFAAFGYWWRLSLTSKSADLDQQIRTLEARKAQLEAVIKQNQVYESLKKKLEQRVKVVEGLQQHQISPVVALDELAEAVERTKFVWLSSVEQKDAVLNMNGTGTSLNAIADFYSNLYATGYFQNVDVGLTQAVSGNFTFSMRCDFAPPSKPAAKLAKPAAELVPNVAQTAGGN
jgi:Tfp pilus assembly protein PilN